MSIFKRLGQRGDTIPEVLICLAVLGSILVSAFTLTNRNQSTAQTAQERTEAVKIANGQLELLRAYTDDKKLPTSNYFCMQQNDTGVVETSVVGDNPESANPDYGSCRFGPDGRFSYTIWSPKQAEEIGGNGDVYAVTVRWDGAISQNEEVKIFYSLFDTSNPGFAVGSVIVNAPACSDSEDNDDDGINNYSAIPGQSDPGCDSASDTTEEDISQGVLVAAADCYAPGDADGDSTSNRGCPEMRAIFTWSDGSTDSRQWTVKNARPTFANYDYSFTKGNGVTLSSVRVSMVTDKWLGTPATDRNLYVRSVSDKDGNVASHTTAYPEPCPVATHPEYNIVNSKMLCGQDPMQTTFYFTGGPASFKWITGGANVASCTADETQVNDGADGCIESTDGLSIFARRNTTFNYALTGVFAGQSQLYIKFRQYPGGNTTPPSGYPGYAMKAKIGSTYESTFTLPVDTSPPLDGMVAIQNIDVPAASGTGTLSLSWSNNGGSDPDLQIDRVMICRNNCENPF